MSTLRQSTSNESGLSSELTNNTLTVASQLSTFSPTQSKLSNNFEFGQAQNSYFAHNNHQGTSSQPFNVNQSMSATDEFDDDISCQEVKPTNEIIYVSSDSEYEGNFVDNNVQKASSSNDKRYCSICKEEKTYNHDCSLYNKEFSTCLVPNCNILFRTIKDFDPHYRQHIGFPTGERLCHWCYKENKKSECDANGYHICRQRVNVFKCYTCNIVFNRMPEFAGHKLKVHNARLINSAGNYLCLYCEKSSQEMALIDDHIKLCCDNKNTNVQNNEIECSTEVPEPEVNVTPVLTNKRVITKKTVTFGEESDNKLENSHKHLLFTCLKPSCNLIFQHFPNFKFHHRQHFQTGSNVMCWQCCTPFGSVASLRIHQVKGNCRTPGMFKCFQCAEGFDDLQSLSIHKYVMHNGELVVQKKNQKFGLCPLCKSHIDLIYFRNHLVQCHSCVDNNLNKSNHSVESKPVPKLVKSRLNPCKCIYCNKVCLTAAALSSHIKVHNPNRLTKIINKKINNKNELACNNVEINNKTNSTSPSTSQNNETLQSVNCNVDDTGSNVEVNSTSNTSHVNQSQRFVDYNQVPFENGLYSCINCPRKFCTKMGLAKHWPYCKPKEEYMMKNTNTQPATPKRILPKHYYCTDCKEYYTRPSFGTHWRMIHGKKLSLKKCKKFSCTKCPIKFMYKVALVMHYQHAHNEENSENNTTEDNLNSVDSLVKLPVVSQTISLANNNLMENTEENCNDQVTNEFNNTLLQSSNLQWKENESNAENSSNTIETQVVESSSNEPDEYNDIENHDDPNMNSNNDTIVHTSNVQNDLTQNDDKLNGEKNAEQLIEIESAMEVDNATELEENNRTKSCEKNVIKVVFGNNDKRNMLSVKKEFSQHCFNKSMTNNEAQNIYKTRNENYQSPNITISKDTNSDMNKLVDNLVNNKN